MTPVNPKEIAGSIKPPLDYLENAADLQIAEVLANGAAKYGRRNFLQSEVRLTTYIGAMRRHLGAISDGEDIDPESGHSHLAHIGANVHVLLAAAEHGTLVDDRVLVDVEEIDEACYACEPDACCLPEAKSHDFYLGNVPCPDAPVCQSCPSAADDDVCLPGEREAAESCESCPDGPCCPEVTFVGPTDEEREEFWADMGRPEVSLEDGPDHDGGGPFRPGARVRVTNELRGGVALEPGVTGRIIERFKGTDLPRGLVFPDQWVVEVDGDHQFPTYYLREFELEPWPFESAPEKPQVRRKAVLTFGSKGAQVRS